MPEAAKIIHPEISLCRRTANGKIHEHTIQCNLDLKFCLCLTCKQMTFCDLKENCLAKMESHCDDDKTQCLKYERKLLRGCSVPRLKGY